MCTVIEWLSGLYSNVGTAWVVGVPSSSFQFPRDIIDIFNTNLVFSVRTAPCFFPLQFLVLVFHTPALIEEEKPWSVSYGTAFELGHLTIRLRARVFYELMVNEAQPTWLSLVENEGE